MPKGDIETYYEYGKWKNKVEGSGRAADSGTTKSEVQAKGRDMATKRGVEHIIRKQDGTIGARNTYPRSRDPRRTKG
ncbi:MAG TPA: DUF2188 domain-containing protein [Mycobacterium sp.]|jgi:hypothetical protein|nr:DUF2188 domain-containing protein [Mycobacterium sp.]